MSLEELDIICIENGRLQEDVDEVKNYIRRTRMDLGKIINLETISISTEINKSRLNQLFKIASELGLFKKVFLCFCNERSLCDLNEDVDLPVEVECDQCDEFHLFTEENVKIGYKINFYTGLSGNSVIDYETVLKNYKIDFGIITALSLELSALKAMFNELNEVSVPGRGAGRRYFLGKINARNGNHYVILAMAAMGNNMAASRATRLLEHFPSVEFIIMVGIAGGVPNHLKVEDHVRLGDIVVSDKGGVIQYDFTKETITQIEHRNPPRPPSAFLVEAVEFFKADTYYSDRPWNQYINIALRNLGINRPEEDEDILSDSNVPTKIIMHPEDSERVENEPKIFYGPIAASNTLLKNPILRDSLRDQFGVKAVEMESSGIADATWNHETSYLVIRGICDYCDENKNNNWQGYASVIAAAYTITLLETIPVA